MPRRKRLNLTDIPLHIVQRGNNRAACFYAEQDYQFYLHWLAATRGQSRLVIKLIHDQWARERKTIWR
jgi:putative transposase